MFRLIEDSFWDDPQIAKLPRDEKLITICLFTNVHTRPSGVYRLALDRLAYATKVPEAAVAKGLKHLAEVDIAYYDGTEICIPGYIRRQRYKGPQMARRIAGELAQVKNKTYVKMIAQRYPDFLRMGGFKLDGAEIPSPQKELHLEASEPVKGKPSGLANLGLFIAEKLKFTGGVKTTVLARLVKLDPDGEAGVRAAVERAVKYFETAKAEKWRSYVMARRFSKFCDFYGECFSSDEGLQIYIDKIRLANEREKRKDEWHKKREASIHIGENRPDESPAKELTPEEQRVEDIREHQESIRNAKLFISSLDRPENKKHEQYREPTLERIDRLEKELKKLESKNKISKEI